MNINKRNKKIYELCDKTNMTYKEIGNLQNPPISRQRVEQIYKSYAKKYNFKVKNRLKNKSIKIKYNPLLSFIRINTNRCPICGSKLYWWGFDRIYCSNCKWKRSIE